MNIHEYQAKEILSTYGVAEQKGFVASTEAEALEAAKKVKSEYNSDWCVVKAQIHAGGRGKGKVEGTEQRGVEVARSPEKAAEIAKNLIGGNLITIQTGEAGKIVNKVLVAQDVFYPGENEPHEYYMSVLLDREQEFLESSFTTALADELIQINSDDEYELSEHGKEKLIHFGKMFQRFKDLAIFKCVNSELPEPEAPVITRMEFDMKDQLVRQTIMTTQEDVLELKEDLDRIEAKIDQLR